MVNFDNVSYFKRKKIEKLFACTLEATNNQKINTCVGVKFASESEIKELNKAHRGIDKVTDVLSFPYLDIKAGEKLSKFKGEAEPNGVLYLGDVVVCIARAKQQAKEYGHSFMRELMFLVTHGFLHCLGYDHIEKADEKKMMALTEKILSNFGLGAKNV